MGRNSVVSMVFSFTEQAQAGGGMLCYQTAAKGECALHALMDTYAGAYSANTGNLVTKSCRDRDSAYKSAMSANALLRAKGRQWQATPGNPTWDMSQWYKGN